MQDGSKTDYTSKCTCTNTKKTSWPDAFVKNTKVVAVGVMAYFINAWFGFLLLLCFF